MEGPHNNLLDVKNACGRVAISHVMWCNISTVSFHKTQNHNVFNTLLLQLHRMVQTIDSCLKRRVILGTYSSCCGSEQKDYKNNFRKMAAKIWVFDKTIL